MPRVRFRHHAGIALAGVVATLGAIPLATARWYLTPILLVPAAIAVWGWRAGTDADESGITVRALFGRRRLPWSRISGLAPTDHRVVAVLDGGVRVPLTAVTPADLPKLVAASGAELATADAPASGEPSERREPAPGAAARADTSLSNRSEPD